MASLRRRRSWGGRQGSSPVVATALSVLVLSLAPSSALAHVLVLESGARLVVREPPVFDVTGWAPVTTPDGRTFLVERSAISASSTEAANRAEPTGAARASDDPGPRRDGGPTTKVWTAADLARLRGGNVSVVGTAGTGEASGRPVPRATEAPAENEAEWRAAALALGQRIAGLERRIAFLERVDASWEGYVIGTGSFQGPIASASASKIADARRQRAEAEAALQQARGELALLEDRARRANVPPGWLRPE